MGCPVWYRDPLSLLLHPHTVPPLHPLHLSLYLVLKSSTMTNDVDLEKQNTIASQANNVSPNLSHQETASSMHDYGRYGPLAQVNTASTRLPAFGGELQPGLYKPPTDRKVANPGPLGLCGFALTTFLLGLIQMQVKDIMLPNIVVGPALAYGGLVQLCAGMWYFLFAD